MKFRLLNVAVMCALCLALLTVAWGAAQTSDRSDTSAASQMSATQLVPGTGVTVADLKDLGWSSDQIADLQSPAAAANENSSASNQNGPVADRNPQNANTGTAANNSGGSGWGLWGLIGLLGLLGLGGRGRRAETVRDERDIRRVA